MKITKKILENIIREEVKKLAQEISRIRHTNLPFDDDQAKVDKGLYLMRKRRGDGGMSPEEKEKANPIKRSHRVSGDIGAPTQERAHIIQAMKSVKAAMAVAQKSELGDVYLDELKNILGSLQNIESATRAKTTGTSAGYTG